MAWIISRVEERSPPGVSIRTITADAPVVPARWRALASCSALTKPIAPLMSINRMARSGAAWAEAMPNTGFRRDVPSDGKPATEESEIRVVYDDHAMYVGARLFNRDKAKVSRRLSRRDSFSVFNDVFFVMIDSYHDHSTSFVFGATPAGERRDAIQSGDGASIDPSWDPVWEVKTRVDSLGWVAEMRIPFSQLRFPNAAEHTWGVQFRRDIRAAGEAVDWSWSPRTEPGTTSKYGHLAGIAVHLGRKLKWDPVKEAFAGDREANALLTRAQRKQWSYETI